MRMLVSLSALLVLLLSGCASPLMKPVEDTAAMTPGPGPGMAQVVFLRPSSFGGAVQSSVYDVRPDGDRFIGIVSSATKVSYAAEPGEHLFMVIGENADFMAAHLEAGKTYHALVSPRFGLWKARFSLLPVRGGDLAGDEFAKWQGATRFVVNTPLSEQWSRDNWDSIQGKKHEYMPQRTEKSDADKAERTLFAGDGI